MKKANDEREAAENARIAADVAAADRKAQETAKTLAEKRRKMQQECNEASSGSSPPGCVPLGGSPLAHVIKQPDVHMHIDRCFAILQLGLPMTTKLLHNHLLRSFADMRTQSKTKAYLEKRGKGF